MARIRNLDRNGFSFDLLVHCIREIEAAAYGLENGFEGQPPGKVEAQWKVRIRSLPLSALDIPLAQQKRQERIASRTTAFSNPPPKSGPTATGRKVDS